jgi:hypothetical protein
VIIVPGVLAGGGAGGETSAGGAMAGLSVSEGMTGMLVAHPERRATSKAHNATRGVDDAIRQWRKARRAVNKIAALRMPAIVFCCLPVSKSDTLAADAVQPLIQQWRFE